MGGRLKRAGGDRSLLACRRFATGHARGMAGCRARERCDDTGSRRRTFGCRRRPADCRRRSARLVLSSRVIRGLAAGTIACGSLSPRRRGFLGLRSSVADFRRRRRAHAIRCRRRTPLTLLATCGRAKRCAGTRGTASPAPARGLLQRHAVVGCSFVCRRGAARFSHIAPRSAGTSRRDDRGGPR